MFTWDDARVCAMDVETSGRQPEWALQPWRIPRGDAWVTSLAWVWPEDGRLAAAGSTMPRPELMGRFLEWAVAGGRVVCGWSTPFDASVAIALGFRDLVFKLRWLDGRLLWRHLAVEPEYDKDRAKKKRYTLKNWVRQHLPQHAGYEEAVDFHDMSPASLERLHEYNIKDNAFTLRACKRLWQALEPRQRQAAWIEAACIPMIADANLRGLLIDTIAAQDLALRLSAQAEALLDGLLPDILGGVAASGVVGPKRRPLTPREVAGKVLASPQKLAQLLFDDWGLPSQKLTDTGNRSTDKEVLHELAFVDPRARKLREFREALNCSKKFAQTPAAAAAYNEDGRAHPLAIMFGTYSGRFTYASKQRRNEAEIEEVADAEE
jgi:hypothetical protein